MMGRPCNHERGDWIVDGTYWLCGQCYAELDEQPKKYGAPVEGGDEYTRHPQVIVWQAELAKSGEMTLGAFVKIMALRYSQLARIDLTDAYECAVSYLKALGISFGDVDYSWTRQDAYDLVAEDMDDWDRDSGGSNG